MESLAAVGLIRARRKKVRYWDCGSPQSLRSVLGAQSDQKLSAGGFGHGSWPSGFRLPGLAQLFAVREDIRFRFVEAGVDAGAFDRVARSAAGHEIGGIFLSFVGARNHEIDAHDQRIFETCASIQTTIAADIIVAFENLAAFFDRYRRIHE
jgi:hypothetical protein